MDVKYAEIQELFFELKISDVMRTSVITVGPDSMMSELREALRDHRISGTPVVENGKLVGIISIEDLIRWLSSGSVDCPIREKMTSDPECLFPDQPVAHAVEKLEEPKGFGRFPVIDRKTKKMVGIITKGDIIEGVMLKLKYEYKEEEIRHYRASHIFEDMGADDKKILLVYNVVGKDFDRAGKASTQMKKNMKRLGIRPDIVRRLAIASYEAEMNAVIYADRAVMIFNIAPDEISMEVKDEGPGIADIEKAMQPGYSTAEDWVRQLGFGAGMGLANIRNCTDKMEIESVPGEGTILKASIVTKGSHET